PLDAAADTRALLDRDRFVREHGITSRAHVAACDRNAVAGAARIELPAIDKFARTAEQKKVWRACCFVGTGHFLGLIEQVVKRIDCRSGFLGHALRTVLRMRFSDVRRNRDYGEPSRLVLTSEPRELLPNVSDLRAVITDERDEKRGRCAENV